jgi:hypothetical protein
VTGFSSGSEQAGHCSRRTILRKCPSDGLPSSQEKTRAALSTSFGVDDGAEARPVGVEEEV